MQKSGRKAIFGVFFTLKTTQNLMKSLGHSWACINFHTKSKNVKFSSRRSPNHKRAQGGATRRARKPVLWPKIQNWQNFLQIPWNLDWKSLIKYHAQPKKLRPRFEVCHTFYTALMPSWCMQFSGGITVLFIGCVGVCHGVARYMSSVCLVFWKLEIRTWCLCLQFPNACQNKTGLW